MAVPKKRKSKAKRDTRQKANDKRKMQDVSVCPQCGVQKLSHRICPSCGFYKDRVLVEKKEKDNSSAA